MNENEIVENFYKLAGAYTRKNQNNTGLELEDLVQELVIDAFDKYKRLYKPEKSELSTFAYCCFKSKLLYIITKKNRIKRYNNTLSLDQKLPNSEFTLLDTLPDDSFIDNYNKNEDLERIKPYLSEVSKEYYLEGKTQKEIAVKYKKSASAINQEIKKNIEMIKGELENEK